MRRPLPALLVALALATGCADGGDGDGRAAATAAAATATAGSAADGSVIAGDDGRTYRVAAPGETLALDDVAVRVTRVRWHEPGDGAAVPPGTAIVAVVSLAVTNRSDTDQRVGPLQFWFVDAAGNTHLAAAGGGARARLAGRRIAPGDSRSGRLSFPLPVRTDGSLLVYRFADARKIAAARHMGLVRLGP